MKHSRWLIFTCLVFAVFAFLVSCDMLGQFIPGFGDSTTSEVTTVTTTDTVTTTATSATTTTTAAAPATVTVAPNAIVEKTPADLPVFNFDGDLSDYVIGYGASGETTAGSLATALGTTAAAYDASIARSIHLDVTGNSLGIALAAGDYHIYVTKGTIHILGGDAAGLAAGVDAFLATVEDGRTAIKAHEHTIHKTAKPTATTAAKLPQLVGTTTKDALSYSLGDEVIFVLRLTAGSLPAGAKTFHYTISADDTEKMLSGDVDASTGILALTVPADMTLIPGSVRLWVNAYDGNGALLKSLYSNGNTASSYTYIGGAIINLPDITSDVPEPSNFEEFWTSLIAKLPDPTRQLSSERKKFWNTFAIIKMDGAHLEKIGQKASVADEFDCYEVFLHCGTERTDENGKIIDGRPAVGYITVPKNKLGSAESLPISIGLNSYSGGASSRDGFFATSKDAICVRMHPQGMPLFYLNNGSLIDSGLKADGPTGPNYRFGIKGSDTQDPATADLSLMLLRNVQMLRYLTDDQYDNKFGYSPNMTKADKEAYQAMRDAFNGTVDFASGGSMGGFQNVATAALCNFAAKLDEPFFHGSVGTITVKCPWMCDPVSMSGLTDRLNGGSTFIGSDGTEISIAGLAYLDTAHFGAHLPKGSSLIILAGFADTTCPSSGIVALYNATTVEKTLTFRQNKDHSGSEPATYIDYILSADAVN